MLHILLVPKKNCVLFEICIMGNHLKRNHVRRGPPTYVYIKPATFVKHLFPEMDYWHGA